MGVGIRKSQAIPRRYSLLWAGELLVVLGISFWTIYAPCAEAQTALQSVSATSAQGTYESQVQEIVLGTTQGVNLSFLNTGEVIQRVWLNDPSRVVVDFDGCLSSNQVSPDGQQAAGSGGSGCQVSGASVMQLRQLAQPIDFPANLAAGTANTAFLTVITSDASGNRKIYQFTLVLRGGIPPVSLINIIPAPPLAPAQLANVSQEYQQTVLRQLSQGLAYAEAHGLVDTASPAYNQARDLIARMSSGTAFAEAMRLSGVPTALVSQLRNYSGMTAEPVSSASTTPLPGVPITPGQLR